MTKLLKDKKNKIYKHYDEVRVIYKSILSLELQDLIKECNQYSVRITHTNLYGLDMIIDDLLRQKCIENDIPIEYEDDIYFGVEYDLNEGLFSNI